ncbi:MAG: hypothetical protein ACJ8LG_13065 [Massilia sp.]
MKTLRAIALALATLGVLSSSAARADASRAVQLKWKAEMASKIGGASGFAARKGEKIIVWEQGEEASQAEIIHLLVDAPFLAVQLAVQNALAKSGGFKSTADTRQWVSQSEGWENVLVSHRQDLRDKLAARNVLPQLAEAFKRGALTGPEYHQLKQAARRKTDWSLNEIGELDELTRLAFDTYCASKDESLGITGDYTSHLEICVFDMSAAFGHPAAAARISRTDRYPTPGSSRWKGIRDFNILSPGPAATIWQRVVPSAAFDTVYAALKLAASGGTVQVAASSLAWVDHSGEAKTTIPVKFAYPYPPAGSGFSNVELVSWDAIAGQLNSVFEADNIYPYDLVGLPNGDLIVGLGGNALTRVWRLGRAKGRWTSELIWEGRQRTHQLELSSDGKTVWFSGGNEHQDTRLFAYDVLVHKTTEYQVYFDINASKTWRWALAGSDYPTFYASERTGNLRNPYLEAQLQVFLPRTPPPLHGGEWWFKTALRVPRDGQPVRWRDRKHLWITDGGLAQVESRSGVVTRSLPLPQRAGIPYHNSSREDAPWVPAPLGSPEANWVAIGYLVMLADDGNPRPKFEAAPTRHTGRFVGMHVIDLNTGGVRMSALLGRSDTLEAAARSANGKLLALGSNGVGSRPSMVALWDVASGRAPLQLAAPANGSLHTLAFSNSGAELWGLYNLGLARWRLPTRLQDAVRHGSLPDQSHN